MEKNKLNLHICGIHLLNPFKAVVSHLKAIRLVRDLVKKNWAFFTPPNESLICDPNATKCPAWTLVSRCQSNQLWMVFFGRCWERVLMRSCIVCRCLKTNRNFRSPWIPAKYLPRFQRIYYNVYSPRFQRIIFINVIVIMTVFHVTNSSPLAS